MHLIITERIKILFGINKRKYVPLEIKIINEISKGTDYLQDYHFPNDSFYNVIQTCQNLVEDQIISFCDLLKNDDDNVWCVSCGNLTSKGRDLLRKALFN